MVNGRIDSHLEENRIYFSKKEKQKKLCIIMTLKMKFQFKTTKSITKFFFLFFFMSIGASLVGFYTSMRPMLATDGTFSLSKILKDFVY